MKIGNKGFSLVALVPALVILGVSAAVVVPKVLSSKKNTFPEIINQNTYEKWTKKSGDREITYFDKPSVVSRAEARIVSLAAKAYAQEKKNNDPDNYSDSNIEDELKGDIDENHVLDRYLNGDANGTICEIELSDGEVKRIVYAIGGYKTTLVTGEEAKTEKAD